MNLQDILLELQFVTNKAHSGRRLTPEYYNVMLDSANNTKFFMEWRLLTVAAAEAGGIVNEAMIVDTPLNRYKKDENLPAPDANGKIDLPVDFHHPFGMIAKYEGSIRKIDIVSEKEIDAHLTSLAMPSLQYAPKAAKYGSYIRVFPFNVGAGSNRIKLTYLRRPAKPNYDFCYRNEVALPIYMPVGSYIDPVGLVGNLYDVDGRLLATNVSHPLFSVSGIVDQNDDYPAGGDRGPVGPIELGRYTSRSVELDWNEEQHPAIISIIMEKLGVNLKDQQVQAMGKEGQNQ